MDMLRGHLAHPEYITEAPSPSNGFQWCWTIYDPISFGEYHSGKAETKERAIQEVRAAFIKLGIIID